MGQPVVHFEVIGKDGERLRSFYSGLFGWTIRADNPMGYGVVEREGNLNADGVGTGGGAGGGIGGGRGGGPEAYDRPVTVHVEVPAVEAPVARAEELGGSRVMGPAEPMEG